MIGVAYLFFIIFSLVPTTLFVFEKQEEDSTERFERIDDARHSFESIPGTFSTIVHCLNGLLISKGDLHVTKGDVLVREGDLLVSGHMGSDSLTVGEVLSIELPEKGGCQNASIQGNFSVNTTNSCPITMGNGNAGGSVSLAAGPGNAITLNAPTITMGNSDDTTDIGVLGTLLVNTAGTNSGAVTIGNSIAGGSVSLAAGTGNAITLTAPTITMGNGESSAALGLQGTVSVNTAGTNSGTVTIGNSTLGGSVSLAAGPGNAITLTAPTITMGNYDDSAALGIQGTLSVNAAGTNSGAVTIGNSTLGGSVSLAAGAGNIITLTAPMITMGNTDNSTTLGIQGTVSVNAAGTGVVAIGNSIAGGTVSFAAGTGNAITFNAPIISLGNNDNSTSLGVQGAVLINTLGTNSGAVTIGNGTEGGTISLAAGTGKAITLAAPTISLGNSDNSTALDLQGTLSVNAAGTNNGAVTIGNSTVGGSVSFAAGTGNAITLTAPTITLGNGETTNALALLVSKSSQTPGTITLSSAKLNLDIGVAATTGNKNILTIDEFGNIGSVLQGNAFVADPLIINNLRIENLASLTAVDIANGLLTVQKDAHTATAAHFLGNHFNIDASVIDLGSPTATKITIATDQSVGNLGTLALDTGKLKCTIPDTLPPQGKRYVLTMDDAGYIGTAPEGFFDPLIVNDLTVAGAAAFSNLSIAEGVLSFTKKSLLSNHGVISGSTCIEITAPSLDIGSDGGTTAVNITADTSVLNPGTVTITAGKLQIDTGINAPFEKIHLLTIDHNGNIGSQSQGTISTDTLLVNNLTVTTRADILGDIVVGNGVLTIQKDPLNEANALITGEVVALEGSSVSINEQKINAATTIGGAAAGNVLIKSGNGLCLIGTGNPSTTGMNVGDITIETATGGTLTLLGGSSLLLKAPLGGTVTIGEPGEHAVTIAGTITIDAKGNGGGVTIMTDDLGAGFNIGGPLFDRSGFLIATNYTSGLPSQISVALSVAEPHTLLSSEDVPSLTTMVNYFSQTSSLQELVKSSSESFLGKVCLKNGEEHYAGLDPVALAFLLLRYIDALEKRVKDLEISHGITSH